jgi:hypothetical protein
VQGKSPVLASDSAMRLLSKIVVPTRPGVEYPVRRRYLVVVEPDVRSERDTLFGGFSQ